VSLPKNITLASKKFATGKRTSLFRLRIIDEEERFYNFGPRSSLSSAAAESGKSLKKHLQEKNSTLFVLL
jgi:hypothetical protein